MRALQRARATERSGDLPYQTGGLWPSLEAVVLPPTILIVDDHEGFRETLAELLTEMGAQVVTARDGLEALEILSSQHVHLVLSDVRMPRCDGVSLAREIQRLSRPPGFILMTGHADLGQRERAAGLGLEVLEKPLDLPALLRLIDQGQAELVRPRERPWEEP